MNNSNDKKQKQLLFAIVEVKSDLFATPEKLSRYIEQNGCVVTDNAGATLGVTIQTKAALKGSAPDVFTSNQLKAHALSFSDFTNSWLRGVNDEDGDMYYKTYPNYIEVDNLDDLYQIFINEQNKSKQ